MDDAAMMVMSSATQVVSIVVAFSELGQPGYSRLLELG